MKQDERDEALGRALDAAVAGVQPDADRRSGKVRRRGSERRAFRWTASVVVVALFVGTFAYLGFQTRNREVSLDTSTWETYEQPDDGWTLRFPGRWQVQGYEEFHRGLTRGALVSNVRFLFEHPDLGEGSWTSAWDMRGLPANAVVLQVQLLSVGPSRRPTDAPSTPFPLSLSDAHPTTDPAGQRYGAPQPRLVLPLVLNGLTSYSIQAWFGEGVRPRDRRVAELIVRSIRFPGTGDWIEHRDPTFGWTVDLPPEWFAAEQEASCHLSAHWLDITNVPGPLHSTHQDADGCGWSSSIARLPSDLTAVEVELLSGGPAGGTHPPDAAFPLSRDGGLEQRVDQGTFHGYSTEIPVHSEDGLHIVVRTLIGDDASPLDIAALDRVLASLQIPLGSEEPSGSNEAALQAAEEFGWTIDEPPLGWQARFQQLTCRQSATALILASQPYEFSRPRETGDCVDEWNLGALPSDIVVLMVEQRVGGPSPVPDPSKPDTEFPVSLEDAALLAQPVYPFEGEIYVIPLWKDGFQLEAVTAFVGADAPAEDAAAMRQLLASFRPVGYEPPEGPVMFEGFGFAVRPPLDWNAWAEGVDCKVSSRWLVVSNLATETHRYVIDGEDCGFRLRQDLPSDAVVVELVHYVTNAGGLDDVPAEPLSLQGADVVDAGAFPGTAYRTEIPAGAQARYVLTVYVGNGAPEASRSTVGQLLASLTIQPWA